MHEAMLARALLEQVVAIARAHGATGVRRIVVRVGALGHGDPEPLRWHFARHQSGTLAATATLEFVATDELVDLVLDHVELDLPARADG